MTAVVRIFGSIVAALMSSALVFLLLVLPLSFVTSLVPSLWNGAAAIIHGAAGFTFVFVGSIVVCAGWRIPIAILLVGLGSVFYLVMQTRYTSEPEGISLWPFLVAAAGGLLALGVQIWNRRKELANKTMQATAATPSS